MQRPFRLAKFACAKKGFPLATALSLPKSQGDPGISTELSASRRGFSVEQLGVRMMNSIIYIVGLVVIVVAVLSFLGLR